MGEAYDPKQIEPKWQARWEADGLYRTRERSDRPKFYFLTMYPYPSGDLHIGHWFTMTASDARARSEEHTSELQSRFDLVCRLLLEKKKKTLDFLYIDV